ncbi:5-oxoprolinase [Ignicoccus islandicus DSM 13165]|uniref:5-oxoprolinase n=1 Tax=Ignicoccus islandicus DSM 13165 TaxID=940295 RepID=A0A0U3E2C8_9CREN|nr:hydantoinase B/oxoprolinase family protein [Ignicoccus islandicus]ALU12075.1 5-oxoprolinase [Ignicoccus islandicus DSM 13165]
MDELKVGIVQKTLSYISEEMGVVLRNSSSSPNIRERLDFSCAIFDSHGRVVAEAEHIPVHLGSMAWASKKLIEAYESLGLGSGDVLMTNDPYLTGTHLNDVTMVSRYSDFYIAVKAHYVDIGGPKAGSLNPFAKYLYEEGIVIKPIRAASNWVLSKEATNLARSVRNPRLFVADVNAQLSSIRWGYMQLKEFIEKKTLDFIKSAIDSYIEITRESYAQTLIPLAGTHGSSEIPLELPNLDIAHIRLSVKIDTEKVFFDFTESDDEVDYNLNAVEGISYAAASFFIKSFFGAQKDVNQGLYDVIHVKTRKGSILNPNYPRAVGAGNLETSQRILQSIILAFSKITDEVPSLGPGTMSNLIISYKDRTYYETNGGGGSATKWEDGENGVQWGMTNTLNTPIEVIESELPILFTEYGIRRNSGGKGRRKGGDGIVREFESLDDITVITLLSQTRFPSYGIGGTNGSPGRIVVYRSGSEVVQTNGYLELNLKKGDRVRLETPGAGGHK